MGQGKRSSEKPIELDYPSQVALDLVPNAFIDTKFGRNTDIDTILAEDVWNGGNDYTGQPDDSPDTIDVNSSSANDDLVGIGAQTLRFYGLKTDTSTEYESEDIDLDGTTPVTSSNTWWRVNRVKILTAGLNGWNMGEITLRHTTPISGQTFAVLPAFMNQSQIAAYTVPYGQQALIKRLRVSITRSTGAAGSANVTLRIREPGTVYRAARNFEIQTGATVDITELGGIVCPAGTDIKVRVESVSDNNTICDASFEYFLFPE